MITWNTNVNAPCAGEIVNDDGRSILIQTDWDYPGVASIFGWNIKSVHRKRCLLCGGELLPTLETGGTLQCDGCECEWKLCDHSHTDGTIDCPDCGVTAQQFIDAAREWLDDNHGVTADDPGYFS